MKLPSALFAATALLVTAGTAQAADITGLWNTDSDNGKVQIYNCGESICGKVVDADQLRANPNQNDAYNKIKSQRSRKVKGLVLFSGYTGGPTEWKGGSIYDPKSGDTGRNGKLKLNGDKLEVKGCLGPICRTKHWTRAR